MREILFKGKRVDNGEWVEGYFVKGKWYLDEKERFTILPLDLSFYPYCEISEWIEVNPETICQFTGISDDKGNRIWENDIVLCEWGATAFGYREYRETIFINDITNHRIMDILQECENIKLLGNRFDSPGMLEGYDKRD